MNPMLNKICVMKPILGKRRRDVFFLLILKTIGIFFEDTFVHTFKNFPYFNKFI